MLWHQLFWWISLHMHLPRPQIQGHFLCLSCDGSGNRCCNQADKRVDKKKETQSIFPSLQPTRLSIFLPSWNGEANFQKRAILGWNRHKVLLIFKWKWLFMDSDFLWINIIFKALKWHSLTALALNIYFLAISKQTNLSEKDCMGKCHLLSTLQCTTLPCLSNYENTGHYASRQKWLAAWFIDFLCLICAAYFKSPLGVMKIMISVTGGCSDSAQEPLGTKAASNVIVSIVCQ